MDESAPEKATTSLRAAVRGDDGRAEQAAFDAAHELFLAVCELDQEARAIYLDRHCAADEKLRRDVEELLVAQRGFGDAMLPPPTLPERIGEYRILGQLGAGGMGVVYEAEQQHPRRLVALKLIRSPFATAEHKSRFEHEAQVLGWLNHPGIATVYAAGTADAGNGPQPFFAMELVHGERIDDYAKRLELGIRARLELVGLVCDAVQHAHQKGVIHRDLKPANILVDRQGQPKVLDFGVARSTGIDMGTTTRNTVSGELLGTLAYMSPEQVRADPSLLDTRSDIYSLGVLTYELLTGKRPHELGSRPLHEAARILIEEDPTHLGVLDRKLRGDVETIVQKAMAKEKERRYASAEELARDIRRFLAFEPIVARPASAIYHLQKFTRRNRVLVSGLLGIFLALSIGLALSAVLYRQSEDRGAKLSLALAAATVAEQASRVALVKEQDALRLEQEARTEAVLQKERAQANLEELVESEEYFDGLLAAPTPYVDGKDVRLVDVLERTAAEIDGAFRDRPLLRARMLQRVGKTYSGLGLVTPGLELLLRAAELFEQHAEPGTLQMARFKQNLASAHFKALEWDTSLALYRESLALLDELALARSTHALDARQGMAQILLTKYDLAAAEEAVQKAIELAQELGPAGERNLASCLRTSALIQTQRGRNAEAEVTCRDALARLERLAGPEAHETLDCLHALAAILFYQQRFDEGETLELRSYAGLVALIDGDHPDLLQRLEALAAFQGAQNKIHVALATYDEALGMCDRLFRGANETRGVLRCSKGWTLMQKGDLAAAEDSLRVGIEELRRTVGIDDLNLATALSNLGTLLRTAGRSAEAVVPLAEAIAIRQRVADPSHARTEWDLRSLASAYEETGDWKSATPHRHAALAIIRQNRGLSHRETQVWTASLAANLLEQDRNEEAFELMDAAFALTESSPLNELDRAILEAEYGASLWRIGRHAEGEAMLRAALAALEPRQNEKSPYLQRARRRLAEIEAASANE